MPDRLADLDDLLARTGAHPYVRGTLRHPPEALRGWSGGGAVLWFGAEAPDALHHVATFGPDAAVLDLLAEVAPVLPLCSRVTLARSAAEVLPAHPARLVQAEASRWDLRWLTVAPPVRPEESLAGPDDDLAALAALQTRACPQAWARPGNPAVRRWWSLRRDGVRLGLAADTTRAVGVGHVSAIGTEPAARGRGVGAALTTAVLRALLAEFDVAALGVYSDNAPAASLYDRLGMARREHTSGLLRPADDHAGNRPDHGRPGVVPLSGS